MSFVSRLRMANMFPVRSDLGNAQIKTGNDDMYEVINAARSMGLLNQPRGLEQVASMGRPQKIARPTFGGMVGSDSNPGADILASSRKRAMDTYDANSQNQRSQQSEGSSNELTRDESHMERYFNRVNKDKTIDASIGQREFQNELALERLKNQQDRTDLTRDKNATTEELNRAKFDLTKSKEENTRLGQDNLRKQQRDSIVSRTQAALTELNRLLTDKKELTTRGRDAFGGVNNMIANYVPWSTDSYDASTTRERLKNLLTLDLLGEMKAQSKTGATGFGQMNMRELGVLENAASRLSGKLSDTDAPGALEDVRGFLNKILADGPDDSNSTERIRVRNKQTGQTGTISANAFNESKYERIQ